MHPQLYSVTSIIMIAALLSGCSSSSTTSVEQVINPGLRIESQIVDLNDDGELPDLDIDTTPGNSGRSFSDVTNGTGFAYQMGRIRGTQRFAGVAGIAPNSDVGNAPTTATATYRGSYSVAYAERRLQEQASGTISLDANFNEGTLTGSAGRLDVNGQITGQNIGGTASYRGVEADLTGRIGSTRAVGAFAGNTTDAVVVGGFKAEAQN